MDQFASARTTRSQARQAALTVPHDKISTNVPRNDEAQNNIKTLPESPGISTTRLSNASHALLLRKHRWLRDGNGPAVRKSAQAWPWANATLVFGQEEAGTAVCIDSSGILLTCAHCIAETPKELDLDSSHWLVFKSGKIVEARCIAWDGRRDLALLRIVAAQVSPRAEDSQSAPAPSQPHFPCAPLSRSAPPLNALLVCIGHPGSEDLESEQPGVATGYDVLVISEGRFRGYEEGQDPQDNEDIGTLKHDCWTYWGHSGAPIFQRKSGLLVGLHSSWDDETGMRRGVPVEAILEFLQEHGQHLGGI